MKKKKTKYIIFGDVFGVLAAVLIFLVPFYFMLVNSLKSKQEAAILSISWPEEMHFENYMEVISYNNYQFISEIGQTEEISQKNLSGNDRT